MSGMRPGACGGQRHSYCTGSGDTGSHVYLMQLLGSKLGSPTKVIPALNF